MRIALDGVAQYRVSTGIKDVADRQSRQEVAGGSINVTDRVDLSDQAKLKAYIQAHHKALSDDERAQLALREKQDAAEAQHQNRLSKGQFSVNFMDEGWAAHEETDSLGYFTPYPRTSFAERHPELEVVDLHTYEAPTATTLDEARALMESGARAVRLVNEQLTRAVRESFESSLCQQTALITQVYDPAAIFGDDLAGGGKDPLAQMTADYPGSNVLETGFSRYQSLVSTVTERKLAGHTASYESVLYAINDIDRALERYVHGALGQRGMEPDAAREAAATFGQTLRTTRNSGASLEQSFAKALEALQALGIEAF